MAEHASEDSGSLVGQTLFGDYRLSRKLGEGGMGAVYLAENPSIEQRIAVKVLHPDAAGNDELYKRFIREAKAISRLTHQNIIRVFIFGTERGMPYLAMEFVEGKPLRDVLFQAGTFDELRAISIMRQCLHALSEAHELGIVHRDLKPDNIMLTTFRGVDEFVKILDFGIAKVREPGGKQTQKLTQAGIVYGTPEYLSPEQAKAEELDGRSDLYSLGVILYEMVTGDVPFDAPTAVGILAAHVYNEVPPPSRSGTRRVSEQMEAIILRALAKDPNERYQSAMEFLAALEEHEATLKGSEARKTFMLDPRELSLVMEVSRAQSVERRNASAGGAADPDPTRRVVHEPAAAPPAAVGSGNRMLVLLIGFLTIVLVGLVAALVLVSLSN